MLLLLLSTVLLWWLLRGRWHHLHNAWQRGRPVVEHVDSLLCELQRRRRASRLMLVLALLIAPTLVLTAAISMQQRGVLTDGRLLQQLLLSALPVLVIALVHSRRLFWRLPRLHDQLNRICGELAGDDGTNPSPARRTQFARGAR